MRIRGWIERAISVAIAAAILSLSSLAWALEVPKLETMDQYTRLQLPITRGTSFQMHSGKAGEMSLTVDRVATGALESLPALQDSRVSQIRVKKTGLDKAEITVQFRDSNTESFAYQQENTLVVDLWRKAPEEKAAPVVVAKAAPAKPKKAAPKAESQERSPAAATSSAKAAKAAVSVEPLRLDRDLFLKFLLPMPELAVTAKDGGFDLPPKIELESRWKFTTADKTTEDGQAFEFAKALFRKKKYGLCLKTIQIVMRDHPDSEHYEELEFLQALAYRNLGESTKTDSLKDRATKILEDLAARREEDGSALPFSRLIVLSFAQKELENKNWLKALQQLEYVSSATTPKDADFPYVQMLLAETYSQVKQPQRAERLYRFLVEKFPKHPLAKEAYYRIADLLSLQKNYGRVAEEGAAAIQAYPEYQKMRPEVLFNMGEAYFWMRNYAQSDKYFRKFTDIASSHTISSLAWVRLGEIQELNHRNLRLAHDNYMKAKNGYPFSKGDLVATVRLARIDLPTEKEPNFVVRTLSELLLDQTVDSELKRMAELTLADYMLAINEVSKSISIAASGMAQTDGLAYELYKHAYQKGLFMKLSSLNDKKKFAEALELYNRERKWLEQYGPETYRVAAGVYRGLGLFASANKLMEQYGKELAEKGRLPASATESAMQLEKAANNFSRGDYKGTLEEVGSRQDAMALYFKTVSEFRLGQKREAYATADRALALMKAEKSNFTDEMVENVAEVVIERDSEQRDYRRMEGDIKLLGALMQKDSERLLFANADALWYQKRHKEAELAFKEAFEKFPKGIRASRGTYNRAMNLVGMGKRDEAVKLLTELRNSGDNVWAESAKQELDLINWEKKYSSVLRTLPPEGVGLSN